MVILWKGSIWSELSQKIAIFIDISKNLKILKIATLLRKALLLYELFPREPG